MATNRGIDVAPSDVDLIDVVEASYDLGASDAEWLPTLLKTAAPILDRGMGCLASLTVRLSNGELGVTQMAMEDAASDLPAKFGFGIQEAGQEVAVSTAAWAGRITTLYERRREVPKGYAALTKHLDCRDILGVWALDPNLAGVNVSMPSKDVIRLTKSERLRLDMVTVHITAGGRLRSALSSPSSHAAVPATELPLYSEALLDPRRFVVSEAAEGAKDTGVLKKIREAAVRVDRARGKLRRSDPEEALKLWHGLVRGRWSLVDWFDTDGRRFVLAKPNAPNLGDPRGLTEPELQVATYAARGETGKIIGYRFGLSPQRVSVLLKSARRKLGAGTQAQLVERMRAFELEPNE